MEYKVILDAGHGGYDNGATYNDRVEKEDDLKLALAVGEILEKEGIQVAYTRNTDVYQSPNEKATIVNESRANFLVSIHRNSSPFSNTYFGVETLICDVGDIKEECARNMNARLEALGFENLGVNIRTKLALLRRANISAVLVEVGFLNSDADNKLFDSKFYDIANGIAQGIMDTVGYGMVITPLFYYRIQVGLYSTNNNALEVQTELMNEGYQSDIIQMGDFFSVLVGKFYSIEQAKEMKKALDTKGYDTLVIAL